MEETKFSNQNMQKYYNKIMSMETNDLNVIIAEKKVELDRTKSLLNVIMICYISFFVLNLPQKVLPEIFDGDWNIASYSILTLISIVLGVSAYNSFVRKHVEEYEVLNYLKEKESNK
ncbi:hypothetical protein IGK15_002928 [Enterococcus sp. AZ045]|nr:hypothetical protein [Enterococcus mundtii]BAO08723.1 hypothetical protein EMQU_3166 [Enterococcus mundtii QU 25]BAO08773.1 hypothetical protein EMQU_3216 [Enterococcus mundtii QU 25]